MEDTLEKFLEAQEDTFEQALAEIKSGRKRGHWMWFIFPQLKGLGFSHASVYYAIQNIEEAQLYVQHPVLGSRLKLIANVLLSLREKDAYVIFGSPDELKLRSSMTLFALADSSEENVFKKVLDKFYKGQYDAKTLSLLNA